MENEEIQTFHELETRLNEIVTDNDFVTLMSGQSDHWKEMVNLHLKGSAILVILNGQHPNEILYNLLKNTMNDSEQYIELLKQDDIFQKMRDKQLKYIYNSCNLNNDDNSEASIELIFDDKDTQNMNNILQKFWSWFVMRNLNNGFNIDLEYIKSLMTCKDNKIIMKPLCEWDETIINCDGDIPKFILKVIPLNDLTEKLSHDDVGKSWLSSMTWTRWQLVSWSILNEDPWNIIEIDLCNDYLDINQVSTFSGDTRYLLQFNEFYMSDKLELYIKCVPKYIILRFAIHARVLNVLDITLEPDNSTRQPIIDLSNIIFGNDNCDKNCRISIINNGNQNQVIDIILPESYMINQPINIINEIIVDDKIYFTFVEVIKLVNIVENGKSLKHYFRNPELFDGDRFILSKVLTNHFGGYIAEGFSFHCEEYNINEDMVINYGFIIILFVDTRDINEIDTWIRYKHNTDPNVSKNVLTADELCQIKGIICDGNDVMFHIALNYMTNQELFYNLLSKNLWNNIKIDNNGNFDIQWNRINFGNKKHFIINNFIISGDTDVIFPTINVNDYLEVNFKSLKDVNTRIDMSAVVCKDGITKMKLQLFGFGSVEILLPNEFKNAGWPDTLIIKENQVYFISLNKKETELQTDYSHQTDKETSIDENILDQQENTDYLVLGSSSFNNQQNNQSQQPPSSSSTYILIIVILSIIIVIMSILISVLLYMNRKIKRKSNLMKKSHKVKNKSTCVKRIASPKISFIKKKHLLDIGEIPQIPQPKCTNDRIYNHNVVNMEMEVITRDGEYPETINKSTKTTQ